MLGQYQRINGKLLKIVRVDPTMHEGTDPSGKPNRWFAVYFEDGDGARFWEYTW